MSIDIQKKYGLTNRKYLFCINYLKDYNATQAAIQAKYSAKTAGQAATRLLKNVQIQQALAELKNEISQKVELTVERILLELMRIAFADLTQVFDEAGNIKPWEEIPEDVRRCITGIDVQELYADKQPIGTIKRVKFASKEKALELLGKYKDMFVEKLQVDDKREKAYLTIDDFNAIAQQQKDAMKFNQGDPN